MNIVERIMQVNPNNSVRKLGKYIYRVIFSNSRITWNVQEERTHIYDCYDIYWYKSSIVLDYLLPLDITEERLEKLVLLM
jgi:hypothetical protein